MEYQAFLDLEPHKFLRAGQTRWLSLEVKKLYNYLFKLKFILTFFFQASVNRIIEQWSALILYFTNCSYDAKKDTECARTDAMLYSLKQPTTKIYFLFLSYVLKILNSFEFQSEEPKIQLLLSKITTLYKTILRSFVKAAVID